MINEAESEIPKHNKLRKAKARNFILPGIKMKRMKRK